ncbi:hypothetical protein [Streptomyces albidoflavus]|uniref:hypothetical protein n=1 Tax=Streptomyces albidoflavus TaxID=1886 RepID=UPI0033E38D32
MTTTPVKIRFETTECGRCDGSGRFGPNAIQSGTCFDCQGTGTRLSARGKTARRRYDEACAEKLTVPATDLKPGDRIFSPALSSATLFGGQHPKRWRTVAAVDITDRQVNITFTTTDRNWYFPLDGRTRLSTPELQEIHRDIIKRTAARYTGAWLDGEEPPAPPKPRRKAPQKEAAAKAAEPRAITNKFPGRCACGATVEAGTGQALRVEGRWQVRHLSGDCPQQEAPAPTPAPKPEPKPEPVTEAGLYRQGETVFRVVESRGGRLYAKRFIPPADGAGARLEYAAGAMRTLTAADRLTTEEAAALGRH